MERLTISLSNGFAAELAAFVDYNHCKNRSEAVHELPRFGLHQKAIERNVVGECVATLSYVYDHHIRQPPKRLTEANHADRDLHVDTMHVNADPESCLEAAVLRDDAGVLQVFSKTVIAERGVTQGRISFAPVDAAAAGCTVTRVG